MALSSAPTVCVSRPNPTRVDSPTPRLTDSRPFSLRFRKNRPISPTRNSTETSSPEPAASPEENPDETPAETPKPFSSLISASNVEKALRGIAITSADHYGRLGIRRGAPYDQVTNAYKRKCEELMNRGLDEEGTSKELELLKESYSILSSEEERRLYDWSLARSDRPGRYVWPFEVDITQTPTQIPPPPEPEDVGPTRLVGYFFVGWLILSFALSVTLNR
ncbi:NAD(P)H-quinone oxidoreductase subunit U, chloroplastic [Magnolia sinica]|uniref:NAD(P)H-quinone oxidoreductase subunit U, chloroplastic n=1 Tax=Magnolia sinica TaxID=86752 RepID=UPI002658FE18|nr:NAD(P)H-quinone oxidoreductase subunit U, chloroplastic [Magnolia sinica]